MSTSSPKCFAYAPQDSDYIAMKDCPYIEFGSIEVGAAGCVSAIVWSRAEVSRELRLSEEQFLDFVLFLGNDYTASLIVQTDLYCTMLQDCGGVIGRLIEEWFCKVSTKRKVTVRAADLYQPFFLHNDQTQQIIDLQFAMDYSRALYNLEPLDHYCELARLTLPPAVPYSSASCVFDFHYYSDSSEGKFFADLGRYVNVAGKMGTEGVDRGVAVHALTYLKRRCANTALPTGPGPVVTDEHRTAIQGMLKQLQQQTTLDERILSENRLLLVPQWTDALAAYVYQKTCALMLKTFPEGAFTGMHNTPAQLFDGTLYHSALKKMRPDVSAHASSSGAIGPVVVQNKSTIGGGSAASQSQLHGVSHVEKTVNKCVQATTGGKHKTQPRVVGSKVPPPASSTCVVPVAPAQKLKPPMTLQERAESMAADLRARRDLLSRNKSKCKLPPKKPPRKLVSRHARKDSQPSKLVAKVDDTLIEHESDPEPRESRKNMPDRRVERLKDRIKALNLSIAQCSTGVILGKKTSITRAEQQVQALSAELASTVASRDRKLKKLARIAAALDRSDDESAGDSINLSTSLRKVRQPPVTKQQVKEARKQWNVLKLQIDKAAALATTDPTVRKKNAERILAAKEQHRKVLEMEKRLKEQNLEAQLRHAPAHNPQFHDECKSFLYLFTVPAKPVSSACGNGRDDICSSNDSDSSCSEDDTHSGSNFDDSSMSSSTTSTTSSSTHSHAGMGNICRGGSKDDVPALDRNRLCSASVVLATQAFEMVTLGAEETECSKQVEEVRVSKSEKEKAKEKFIAEAKAQLELKTARKAAMKAESDARRAAECARKLATCEEEINARNARILAATEASVLTGAKGHQHAKKPK
eukprot:CAMPEP_0184994218 /NCGR_PEP_ID=MMETSP1098-20130426/48430_1 /TAXON_ID=89044 /ORGANISM="Spumella elongata, Strain CCAP 955/1" /LENGTH=867 /DNA_ID=CAMNT_0027520229 /DNA_START=522 /DNA_END=3125 /DNA_ORIENTATION=-